MTFPSFPRLLLTLTALLGAWSVAATARAETVVTACGTDNALGGTNFESAIAAGGDIVIRCAGGSNEIRFTRMHVLTRGITIDGEKKVTLIGPGSGLMFQLAPFSNLTLKGLTIRNPPVNPADPRAYTGVVYGPKDHVGVDLLDVQVSDTRVPFVVERLRARNSHFLRNGHGDSAILGVVMAAQMELVGVTFEANLARPFLSMGIDGMPNLVVRGRVSDSVFKGNKAPAMWRFGTFLSDGNRFENNGEARAILNDRAAYDLPDTLRIDDDTGPMLAGALELHWTRATIDRTMFKGNKGVIGGAILIIHAEALIQSSQLDDNQASAGGAVAAMRVPPREGEPTRTTLDLLEVKLRRNRASNDGGALFGNGDIGGSAVLISDNWAGANGGAIAWIGPSLSLPAALPTTLRDGLLAVPGAATGSLELRQAFLIDNESSGSIVDGQGAAIRFGNVLAARNKVRGGGAVIRGASVLLASSTITNNQAAGLAVAPGQSGARLVNTILADNAGGNCTGGAISTEGANLQLPGKSCGGAAASGSPALDSRFAPGLGSPARAGGTATVCASHPLVQGRDVYGDPRGPGTCSIGAVEASAARYLTSYLPRSWVEQGIPGWLIFVLLLFFLICFIFGWIFGLRRRRRLPDQ